MKRRLLLLGALLLLGCAAPRSSGPPLRDAHHIDEALRRAEFAYREGDFHQSVDETTPILRSRPDPKQRYQALKLRALAACRAKEAAAPDADLAGKLTRGDREAIAEICQADAPRQSL